MTDIRERALDRPRAGWLMGVDIGGTFTDLVAVDTATGRVVTGKGLTTPDDPIEGILAVVAGAAASAGVALTEVSDFVHATTLAINAVIQRTGARVGLVTTAGFRDVLEVGRANRYDMYDLHLRLAPPLVERAARLTVTERIGAGGAEIIPVDAGSLASVVEAIRDLALESVAICLLHAYRNPDHERQVGLALAERLEGMPISLSSDVIPTMGEYERVMATAVNAYVAPRVQSYLGQLAASLREQGYSGAPQVMRSDGGWFSADEASRHPVRILESGPTAGAIAAGIAARARGERVAVAFDMGGTTAKACLVLEGEPAVSGEIEISRLERFKKGSGIPIRLPCIDLIEIGAGGGSIAGISPLGLLQVGPASAGAAPGPACYGRGGERPTVTDADLLLGYLNPGYFAGGTMTLDRSAAANSMAQVSAAVETASPVDVAWAIHDLVNENMARAVRLHCIEHGVDPAEAAIVVTGGAGPLHAAAILGKLGATRVICPPDVGVASAFGLLRAPRMVERTLTSPALLDDLSPSAVDAAFDRLRAGLGSPGDWTSSAEVQRFLNMRLRGQGYQIRIRVPDPPVAKGAIAAAFAAEYESRYGRPPSAGTRVEIVDWTVRLVGPRPAFPDPDRSLLSKPDSPSAGRSRSAYWGPGTGWVDTPVHPRQNLASGTWLAGPVLIEEPTSTIVAGPGQMVQLDSHGNICIEDRVR